MQYVTDTSGSNFPKQSVRLSRQNTRAILRIPNERFPRACQRANSAPLPHSPLPISAISPISSFPIPRVIDTSTHIYILELSFADDFLPVFLSFLGNEVSVFPYFSTHFISLPYSFFPNVFFFAFSGSRDLMQSASYPPNYRLLYTFLIIK